MFDGCSRLVPRYIDIDNTIDESDVTIEVVAYFRLLQRITALEKILAEIDAENAKNVVQTNIAVLSTDVAGLTIAW